MFSWGSSSEEQLSSCSKGGDSATLVDAGKEGKAGCSDESNADRKVILEIFFLVHRHYEVEGSTFR